MNNSREAIASALFTLLQNGFQWSKSSRTATIWSNVDAAEQPAMFLIHTHEAVNQNQAMGLPKWTMYFTCLIYAKVDPSTGGPPSDTQINTYIDAIDNALHPSPGEKQTLGGLVLDAFITGDLMIDPGILDQQIAIVIPIRVLTGA